MKEKRLFSYIFIVFGLLLGFILFMFDRWRDTRNYPLLYSWSVAILAYMISGGVSGHLLKKIFDEQRKREEVIKEAHKRLQDLFNSLPGTVIVLGKNYQVHFANRNYVMEFGTREGEFCYDVLAKKNLVGLFEPF